MLQPITVALLQNIPVGNFSTATTWVTRAASQLYSGLTAALAILLEKKKKVTPMFPILFCLPTSGSKKWKISTEPVVPMSLMALLLLGMLQVVVLWFLVHTRRAPINCYWANSFFHLESPSSDIFTFLD